MKKEDVKVYKEIQKNAGMAITALDVIADKVFEDDLAMQIARQSMKYSEIHNKAKKKLLDGKAQPYQKSGMKDFMLTAGIHSNTLLNTSTSHIAELLIQGSNRGITEMYKILNHCPNAEAHSVEMAKELMDFEEKNIARLRRYL